MKKYKTKKIVKKIIYSLLALLVVGIILFPIIWMLPAAFKGKQEIWAIPNTFSPRSLRLKTSKGYSISTTTATTLSAVSA